VLVDSGSIGTFVSEHLINKLKLLTIPCEPVTYRAADGGFMLSDQNVQQLRWFIQGYKFTYEARVLPLNCYDLIVGEDWLEACSPMWMDYKLKTMKFSHEGQMIELQGVKDDISSCPPISATKLKGLIKHGAVSHCIQMIVPSQQQCIQAKSQDQAEISGEVEQLL
jgi:hypothetical protein